MKTIIAEKPSVAREIARIVGATKRGGRIFRGRRLRRDMGIRAPRPACHARLLRHTRLYP